MYYCVLIVAISVLGGMLPTWLRLTHQWMECAVSCVAGVMLGVALLHLLPHAVLIAVQVASQQADPTAAPTASPITGISMVFGVCLLGFLAMFFVERFFCFHHHDVPSDAPDQAGGATDRFECDSHDHAHTDHVHDISWTGASFGLAVHSIVAGIGLAASVAHEASVSSLPGVGAFLAIFLHKPFDSMTISTLMAKGGYSPAWRAIANGAFALSIPLGVAIFYVGAPLGADESGLGVSYSLAFAAGMFLCISMSDLLPELQFHHHDRLKLSAALLLGLGIAIAAARVETLAHRHPPTAAAPDRLPAGR
ncbi:ZIP Zinc transporter [Pirellulimonas nuda]|uniref:ZIP Zinc transporter n=2 Tax=Pirellulimonas nuda TaxID=2528009 RepID=A0A518DA67_9BACT|nr:ZIP Zinc transporter [Pirellulimonas nuda]